MQRQSSHTMSRASWGDAPLGYLFKDCQAMVEDWESIFADTGMLSKVANRCPFVLSSEIGNNDLTSIPTNKHAYCRADSEKLLVNQPFHNSLRRAVSGNNLLTQAISNNHPTKVHFDLCVLRTNAA